MGFSQKKSIKNLCPPLTKGKARSFFIRISHKNALGESHITELKLAGGKGETLHDCVQLMKAL